MAVSDYAFALSALMGTLLVPFSGLYMLLRLKRGTEAKLAPVRVR